VPSTNCLNNGVQLTKNYRCANLVCLNQGVHPTIVCRQCATFASSPGLSRLTVGNLMHIIDARMRQIP
jgi:hypothetical protein